MGARVVLSLLVGLVNAVSIVGLINAAPHSWERSPPRLHPFPVRYRMRDGDNQFMSPHPSVQRARVILLGYVGSTRYPIPVGPVPTRPNRTGPHPDISLAARYRTTPLRRLLDIKPIRRPNRGGDTNGFVNKRELIQL